LGIIYIVPRNFTEFHKLCRGIWQNLPRKNGGPAYDVRVSQASNCPMSTYDTSFMNKKLIGWRRYKSLIKGYKDSVLAEDLRKHRVSTSDVRNS